MKMIRNIPWPRIFAEGAIIVVSILLAFWIQAWWERTKDSEEQERILIAVLAELRSNIESIDGELEYRRAAQANIERIIALSSREWESAPNQAGQLVANLAWWGDIDFAVGALDGLIQGGRLPIIQNEILRLKLAALPDEYAYVDTLERQTYESYRNTVAPYLIDETYFPQIASGWSAGRAGGGGAPLEIFEYPKEFERELLPVLQDQKFHGILVLRWADHADAVYGYHRIRSTISDVIELIEVEVRQ